eukprot:753020-Hanusia_phi.AAC.1
MYSSSAASGRARRAGIPSPMIIGGPAAIPGRRTVLVTPSDSGKSLSAQCATPGDRTRLSHSGSRVIGESEPPPRPGH